MSTPKKTARKGKAPRSAPRAKAAAPAKRKAHKRPPRAKKAKAAKPRTKALAVPKGAVALPPNTPVFPCNDPLLGNTINANVNCRMVTNRKGKQTKKCERQRIVITACATPSASHPRRKQLYGVQQGQRFNIPDRTIRRDLGHQKRHRARYASEGAMPPVAAPARSVTLPPPAARAAARAPRLRSLANLGGCADYEQAILAGQSVPPIAFEQCPGLPDALEAPHAADTSFEFKTNGRRGGRKPNHHGGEHRYGDPLGVYMPPLAQWGTSRSGRRHTTFWQHPRLGWSFHIVDGREGSVWVPDTHVYGLERQHLVARPAFFGTSAADIYDQMRRWYASVPLAALAFSKNEGGHFVTHYFGEGHAFDPGRKPNRAAAAPRVPGQTLRARANDPLAGHRVSGDDYSGAIRVPSVGDDGRTRSHYVGGHVLPRSQVAAGVRRESLRYMPARPPVEGVVVSSRPLPHLGPGGFESPRSLASRYGAGGFEEARRLPVSTGPVAQTTHGLAPAHGRATNAEYLERALAKPGTVFTHMSGAEHNGFPGVDTFRTVSAPVQHHDGSMTIDVKEGLRGRKLMRLKLHPHRVHWIWLGEIDVPKPQLMEMFDPKLAPAMAAGAPRPPVVAGELEDIHVAPSAAAYGQGRTQTDAYAASKGRSMVRAAPSLAAPRVPPPRPQLGAGGFEPARPLSSRYGTLGFEEARRLPPPAPAAAPGTSDDDLAALFMQLAGPGAKPNRRSYGRPAARAYSRR